MENGASRSAVLPPQTALPHKSQSIDVMGLIAAAGLKNYNGAVNLILETEHKSQGLIIAAGSVDQKNTYVFEVTSRPVAQSASKGVSYWNTRDGNDTMVAVWNPADEAQDFLFTLNFSGGHYALPLHLEPRATREFNVSEIIHTQVPDAEGNIIPASVREGSAMISGTQDENEMILIAVEAGIYNVRKATCADIVCSTCHGGTSGDVLEDPFGVAVGASHQLHFLLTWDTGHQYDYSGGSQWTSNHTNIATVASGSGNVTGVSPGSVAITAIATEVPEFSTACYPSNLQPPECGFTDAVGSSGGGVGFTVSRISPLAADVGTSAVPVVITGSGFGSSPGVSATGGISVSGVTVNPAGTTINAIFGLANASSGPQTVTVNGPVVDGHAQTGTVPFAVTPLTCPTSVAVSSITQESLSRLFPAEKTGLGITAAIQVGPSSSSWNGAQLVEALSPTSSTCPKTAPWKNGNLCIGSSTFTVGEGPVETVDGQILQAQSNSFYDEHTLDSNVSLLDYSGISSCQAVCKQTYSCKGKTVGTVTVTFSFSKSRINNTPVTIVTVTDH